MRFSKQIFPVTKGTGPLSSPGGCSGLAHVHTHLNTEQRPDIQAGLICLLPVQTVGPYAYVLPDKQVSYAYSTSWSAGKPYSYFLFKRQDFSLLPVQQTSLVLTSGQQACLTNPSSCSADRQYMYMYCICKILTSGTAGRHLIITSSSAYFGQFS